VYARHQGRGIQPVGARGQGDGRRPRPARHGQPAAYRRQDPRAGARRTGEQRPRGQPAGAPVGKPAAPVSPVPRSVPRPYGPAAAGAGGVCREGEQTDGTSPTRSAPRGGGGGGGGGAGDVVLRRRAPPPDPQAGPGRAAQRTARRDRVEARARFADQGVPRPHGGQGPHRPVEHEIRRAGRHVRAKETGRRCGWCASATWSAGGGRTFRPVLGAATSGSATSWVARACATAVGRSRGNTRIPSKMRADAMARRC
jgi:hypothetical protein